MAKPVRPQRRKGDPVDGHQYDRQTARSLRQSMLRKMLGRWDGKSDPKNKIKPDAS